MTCVACNPSIKTPEPCANPTCPCLCHLPFFPHPFIAHDDDGLCVYCVTPEADHRPVPIRSR